MRSLHAVHAWILISLLAVGLVGWAVYSHHLQLIWPLPFIALAGTLAPTQLGRGTPTPASGQPVVTRDALIAWNPPATMRAGRTQRIEVRLADATVAIQSVLGTLKARDATVVARLNTSLKMRVRLFADDEALKIAEVNSQDQLVRPGEVAGWDYDVTPLQSGNWMLRLVVTMRWFVDNKDETIDLPAYEREVKVALAPVYATKLFMLENWKWIAGMVTAALGWILINSGLAAGALHMIGLGVAPTTPSNASQGPATNSH